MKKQTDTTSTGSSVSSESVVNLAPFTGSAGVKNANQILTSMATVTRMPLSSLATGGSNSSTAQFYSTISPFLSPDGAVTSINPAMLLSVTGLASRMCLYFSTNEAANPTILRNTGLSFAGSAIQFTNNSSTVTAQVINALSVQFWGRQPTADEAANLTTLIQTAASSTDVNGNVLTVQEVVLSACTVMLASPAFLAA